MFSKCYNIINVKVKRQFSASYYISEGVGEGQFRNEKSDLRG